MTHLSRSGVSVVALSTALGCGECTKTQKFVEVIQTVDPKSGLKESSTEKSRCVDPIPVPARTMACSIAETDKCEAVDADGAAAGACVALERIRAACGNDAPTWLSQYDSTCVRRSIEWGDGPDAALPGVEHGPLGPHGFDARAKRDAARRKVRDRIPVAMSCEDAVRAGEPWLWQGDQISYYASIHEWDEIPKSVTRGDRDRYKRFANATLLIAPAEVLSEGESGCRRLATTTIAAYVERNFSHRVCACEPFANQPIVSPVGPIHTAVAIDDEFILTTFHAAASSACNPEKQDCYLDGRVILLNFRMPAGVGGASSIGDVRWIPGEDVKIVAGEMGANSEDWMLLKLERGKLPGLTAADRMLPHEIATVGEQISSFGHPFGLPLKWAAPGRVSSDTKGDSDRWFLHDLDAQAGSSGSPVFRVSDARFAGIVVSSGDYDVLGDLPRCNSGFAPCHRAKLCPSRTRCGEGGANDGTVIYWPN